MRILVDVNVIMDLASKRHPFDASAAFVWKSVEEGNVEGVVSAVTLTTMFYLTKKMFSKSHALAGIEEVRRVFIISPVNAEIVKQALESGLTDFEDAVQLYSGLAVGVTHVVTRDLRGFKDGPLPVVAPEQFPALLRELRG